NMNGTSQNYDYLFTINTTNGNMELVRQFNTINDIEGMAFDAVGDLYVTSGANASSSSLDNTLWKVDLQNGDVTKAFTLWGGDMETCDCVFGDPITTVEVSGYVFYDANEDTTFNTGDYGKNGYLVYLYKDANNNGKYDNGTDVFVDTIRTYADGYYNFRLEYTSGTDNYVLFSNTGDLPANNEYTTDNVEVASFTAGRQKDENNNFGYVVDSTNFVNVISGTVYADVNENGVRESFENGVSGVKVLLYSDDDCDGTIDNGEQVLESTVVGADGKYSFIRNYDTTTTTTSNSSLSKRVSSGSDDAYQKDDAEMRRWESQLRLGYYLSGVRFRSLTIPQGATITSAYVTFMSEDSRSAYTKIKIYGEDTDDANSFGSSDYDISSRTYTSNSKTWEPGSWYQYYTYNTPDISDIVEEIVGRNGWVSGNDMVLIFDDIDGRRDAYSYDGYSSQAPVLVVNYQTSTTTSTGATVCYTTAIDESTVPSGSSLTTDNIETAVFTSGGNHDSLNDFGLWGGALPVEWLSFEGRLVGNVVQLDWATGSEDNNSHFVIERTHDGAHWETIGQMNGAGYSVEVTRYQFIDERPYADVNYYRIKQVDFDGSYDYSDVVMVNSLLEQNDLSVNLFPNPAKDYVKVRLSSGAGTGKVQVIDINGKMVQDAELNFDGTANLDLSNVDTGIYFVKYVDGSTNIVKRLVIKH
ncbi:MAG: T9SS type A sorting domain-containing protein, partial [Bacteroidia bacterium]|nr:T9SS type A sorting domain-containing protein [Bacteroidia bacterium]